MNRVLALLLATVPSISLLAVAGAQDLPVRPGIIDCEPPCPVTVDANSNSNGAVPAECLLLVVFGQASHGAKNSPLPCSQAQTCLNCRLKMYVTWASDGFHELTWRHSADPNWGTIGDGTGNLPIGMSEPCGAVSEVQFSIEFGGFESIYYRAIELDCCYGD